MIFVKRGASPTRVEETGRPFRVFERFICRRVWVRDFGLFRPAFGVIEGVLSTRIPDSGLRPLVCSAFGIVQTWRFTVYIYIYIHTHVCVCVYIYIYVFLSSRVWSCLGLSVWTLALGEVRWPLAVLGSRVLEGLMDTSSWLGQSNGTESALFVLRG